MTISRRRLLINASALVATAPLLFARESRAAGEPELKILGRWKTGNGVLNPFTVDGARLYSSGDKTLEAWDIERGERLWRQPLDAGSSFRPRLAESNIITGGHRQLAVWDKNSGEPRWSRAPKEGRQLGIPTYNDGRIHFGEGSELVTVDAETGKTLWTFPAKEGSQVSYITAVYKDAVLTGPGDGLLYALSARDGKLLWSIDNGAKWQYLRQLHISGDILVAGGYKDNLFGIDPTQGKIMWGFESGNFINSHLAVGDMAYFWSSRGWIFAVNIKTGGVVWRHRTMDYQKKWLEENWSAVMAEIVSDGGHLYILDMKDVLRILDAKTGDKIATYKLPIKSRYFITLVPGARRMAFGSTDGDILLTELP